MKSKDKCSKQRFGHVNATNRNSYFEYHFYPHDVVSAVYAIQQRGWVAGWVSVTRRYCVKTAKPILKLNLFRSSGIPIILISSDPAPIPNSNGNPHSVGVKHAGIGDFRRKSPFISETVRDSPIVTMER